MAREDCGQTAFRSSQSERRRSVTAGTAIADVARKVVAENKRDAPFSSRSPVSGGACRGKKAPITAVAILKRVKGYAEQKNVTLCMENTNSKIAADQRTDQVFDNVARGLDVCKRANSPRVKILYDICRAQIMDGDITLTLRENIDHICHIHVAGMPGRLEINDAQELNFRFIARAIADLGYTGFVAHEWRPAPGNDSVKDLERCFEIMNV